MPNVMAGVSEGLFETVLTSVQQSNPWPSRYWTSRSTLDWTSQW
jgi:hypothetical protein